MCPEFITGRPCPTAVAIGVGFIPVIGDAIDIAGAVVGQDLLTGEDISGVGVAATVVGTVLGSGKLARMGVDAVGEAASAGRRLLPFKDADRLGEVNNTLDRIANGTRKYAQDGAVFRNREGRLPKRADGYYREYTVDSPGAKGRGGRRIVQGQNGETYYSDDHYGTFTQVDPNKH